MLKSRYVMDPNNPQFQPQPQPMPQPSQGIEYLNSIAPQTKVKTVNPFILWGLIVAAVVIVILVVIGLAGGGNSPTKQLTVVGASTSNLKDLSEDASKDIQSTELRSINSSLTIVLTNANRDLAPFLKSEDINLKNTKKNKTLGAVVAGYTKVSERLEDARLNGVYDRTYVREVSFLLKTLHADMEELFNSSRSKSLKTALESNDNNLAPLLESLEAFQAE